MLSSLPGATANLYLDFLGETTPVYGAYSSIITPAYDQDGDPTTFSNTELTSIRSIWSYVAEDYAPFNINVSTVPPASMTHGLTEHVVIGGDGAWTGTLCGGMTYISNFTNIRVPNVAFVFAKNLAGGDPRITGDAISHESGHGFGLLHQSQWSGGTLAQEYSSGSGDGAAPLMGNSYSASRSLWWLGPTDVSPGSRQDDMAVLAGPANGFGYRHDTASTLAAAIPLTIEDSGRSVASGLLLATSDVDYFAFDSAAGTVRFTVSPPANVGNLVPKISILDANGAVVAAAGPSQGFSATVTTTLTAAGSYRIAIASNGGYGNVGHYSLSGTVIPWSKPGSESGGENGDPGRGIAGTTPLDAPAGLTVVAVSADRINLAWSSVASAAGYLIEGSTDGATWITLGGTTAGVTTFSDPGVAPGTSRAYRVQAIARGVASAPSAVVTATIPAAPASPPASASLYLVSRAPRQVVLAFHGDGKSVEGFQIERSTNGRNWTTVGKVHGSSASLMDSTVAPNKTYYYRLRTFNVWGSSAPSPIIRVITPRAMPVAFMRKKSR